MPAIPNPDRPLGSEAGIVDAAFNFLSIYDEPADNLGGWASHAAVLDAAADALRAHFLALAAQQQGTPPALTVMLTGNACPRCAGTGSVPLSSVYRARPGETTQTTVLCPMCLGTRTLPNR